VDATHLKAVQGTATQLLAFIGIKVSPSLLLFLSDTSARTCTKAIHTTRLLAFIGIKGHNLAISTPPKQHLCKNMQKAVQGTAT